MIARAASYGFHRVGIADADCERRYDAYRAWIEADLHGEMAYLATAELVDARASCEKIAAGARSIISVAIAYDHREPPVPELDDTLRGRVARYARGRDYHGLIKERLRALADELAASCRGDFAARATTDTAPILERAVAERAGLGFVGKNTMLISPGLGSYTLLGELLTTTEIAPTSPSTPLSHCGECRACLDACPTGALPAPFVLDANRCISYLTIEHRGPLPHHHRRAQADMVFGCDICQEVCPYNAAAPARATPEPMLSSTRLEDARPNLLELVALGSSAWKRLSAGRAIRRATRPGLMRNAAVALGNRGDARAIEALAKLLSLDSSVLVEHASWALRQIAKRSRASRGEASAITLRDYLDDDWPALCEVHDLARIIELTASGLVAAFLPLSVAGEPEGLFDGRVRIAEAADQVVGFAAISDCEITWLYVHPSRQRRGIGRALLRDALDIIGDSEAAIDVLADNAAAIALYESEGFEIVSRRSGRLQGNEKFQATGVHMVRSHRTQL